MQLQFTTKDIERFWSKVDASGDCWIWMASCNRQGYGQFSWKGTPHLAHRIAYEMLINPIPARMTLDHLCRTHNCINPDHLQVATLRENILRGYSVSSRNIRITHCPAGHLYDEDNILHRPNGGRRCRSCNRIASRNYRQRLRSSLYLLP